MAYICSPKPNSNYQVRSISLPPRSHPTTVRIEEELNKLKIWESSASTQTAETICNALTGLVQLYKCTDELLKLPVTQQLLCRYQNEKLVDGLSDGSLRLLDICGNTKDAMSQLKQYLGDLQSCLRRKKVDLSITKFTSLRKKMKKDAKRMTSTLKRIGNEAGGSQMSNIDHHFSSVIRVLREVRAITISILESLLVVLSVPILKPIPTKFSLVSKLMRKGRVACEAQLDNVNELEALDYALSTLSKYGLDEKENMQIAQHGLDAIEGRVEEIENALECIFRRLISTRASLLNIISR